MKPEKGSERGGGKKITNQPTQNKQPAQKVRDWSVSNEYPLHKNLGGLKRTKVGSQEDGGRMKYLSQNEWPTTELHG